MLDHLTQFVELNHRSEGYSMYVQGGNPFTTAAALQGFTQAYCAFHIAEGSDLEALRQLANSSWEGHVVITVEGKLSEAFVNDLMELLWVNGKRRFNTTLIDNGQIDLPEDFIKGMIIYPMSVMELYDPDYQAFLANQTVKTQGE